MALGSPLAPVVARRVGTEAALALMALTVAAGILVRLLPTTAALYAGTVIAGLGIAVGNVLVPSIIKRDFPDRVGLMTGGYTMAISASGALAAGLTVPLENAIGRDWRAALAVWALPALVAAALWVPWAARGAAAARTARDLARPSPRLWRDPLAWRVTAFMGLQSLLFYSALSWLPALLRSEGIDARGGGRAAVGDAAGRHPHLPARAGVRGTPARPARGRRADARGHRRRARPACSSPPPRSRPCGSR